MKSPSSSLEEGSGSLEGSGSGSLEGSDSLEGSGSGSLEGAGSLEEEEVNPVALEEIWRCPQEAKSAPEASKISKLSFFMTV